MLIRRMEWRPGTPVEPLVTREWIVTNGLGGYASGTVSGAITRRFHGLLIAALPAPLGRRMMFNGLGEQLRFPDGRVIQLGAEERADTALVAHGAQHLREFRLEYGLPIWDYEVEGALIEKRLVIPHRQNTVHITYRLLRGGPVRLELRPALHFRAHEGPLGKPLDEPYVTTVVEDRFEFGVAGGVLPSLRMIMLGQSTAFTFDHRRIQEVLYRIEESRGYESRGDLWSPGFFHAALAAGASVTLVASTESWHAIRALSPAEALAFETERLRNLIQRARPEAREGMGAELVLAADQFLITPVGRLADMARAQAAGDEVRTVIAGYHWFTDWGRDAMISLEGLTLSTGRQLEAGWILRTFAYYVRDGLLPNMFPEGEREGLYHTADASMWFFHAVDRYLQATGDRATLRAILPKLIEIVRCHLAGTRFGIRVDPADGLLTQGAEGYQLTWMDAKVDGWVVTPRRGKAVEINALWYNALRLLEGWLREEKLEGIDPRELNDAAEQARTSFNQKFWYAEGGYLYDVVDGEAGHDAALRPNQLLAIAPSHPVLDRIHWQGVVDICREHLLTPVGMRSLAPAHPDYKPQYYGDLRTRDAAYHQGTVWSWLLGPFIDAWLKVYPENRQAARAFLQGFESHLGESAIGSISEIFDAEDPFTPRGCIAQAWSVAEVLRCWVRTAE